MLNLKIQAPPQLFKIPSGKITDIIEHSLSKRFLIMELIRTGNNNYIFGAIETTRGLNKHMVVKISESKNEMCNEIKTLKRLCRIQQKKYGNREKGLIPVVHDSGVILVEDIHGSQKLYIFSVMLRLRMTVHEYLLG